MVTDMDKHHKTSVIWDNVNPMFYECLDTLHDYKFPEEMPPIILDLYDRDEAIIGSDTADFLSRAVIYV